MALKTEQLGSGLIDAICDRVREQLPEDEAALAEPFVRQYYRWVLAEDLARRSESELAGAALAHWRLAQTRRRGEPNLRVLNPSRDRDGWESPRTVVQIVSDDMPFIVDSVTMELGREGHSIDLVIHPVIVVRRDEQGRVVEVLAPDSHAPGAIPESVLHAELVREPDAGRLEQLREGIERVLAEVRRAVEDWRPMRERMLELARGLERDVPGAGPAELEESAAFLRWAADDHFTFLGYREYDMVTDAEQEGIRPVEGSGLGILRRPPRAQFRALRPTAMAIARSPDPLILTKANSRATVHRPSYLDYIGVKRFGADGRATGECRFLGLYSSTAYRTSAREIPLLRGKVRAVLERAGFPNASHDEKALLEILETYPRDSLLQMDEDDLFEIAIGLLGLGERPWVRLFVWRDPLERFVTCLVTIPRDRYITDNRERIGRILMDAFSGTQLDYTVQLSESVLVRVHYVVRHPAGVPDGPDVEEIERRIVRATRVWSDDLRAALIAEHGEEVGLRLYRRYREAFGTAYRSDADGPTAVQDIARLERIGAGEDTLISLYRPRQGGGDALRCKLYSSAGVSLSDVLPTFEHMGARVVDERPYPVQPEGAEPVWIYDFGLRCRAEDVEAVDEIFEAAFLDARRGRLEDDGLNALVLAAALPGREVAILRAIAKYLRQAGIAYSDAYMGRTLRAHPDVARLLVKLFLVRLNPDGPDPGLAERLGRAMEMAIDGVPSLDEDRILRNFLAVVRATVRTSYFRKPSEAPSEYLSFKLEPATVPAVPEPRPKFEVFVYSPRFEGVHLRGGKVARGGIRWSERPEDFRTEVLGLMKAQMIKNALIVPVGAKGAFVLKRAPSEADRLRGEATECYRLYLAGLLDLTDNIRAREIVAPYRVVRYDDDDPYLVVAPDKGTASFSDLANEVAAEYEFWLGDAFASGGSHGYDHKAMGITARGAWESVKRHFRELGRDIQLSSFTVAGIGDMSGDVFGNGMLLSRQIKLVAAFNHRHVFLDPDPDPELAFAERKRLFERDRSSWADYDAGAISEGGSVHERNAKSIAITPQVAEALAIDSDEMSPSELIRAILRAPVDLLWNGGIGTYVKAAGEANADVGDKANDALRVDGRELRCRVVGEGGNLGFTQRGRIEYAIAGGPEQQGGRINTDSIDNVGGVNASDHEVNIKILLDELVADGELTFDQRNELLTEMTDAVAEQVRYASYAQTEAISVDQAEAAAMIDVHARLIRRLEQVAGLNRELEFLPSEDEISERKAARRGLVAPELAIVMAYCKIYLYDGLLESDLPDDEDLFKDLERYFPQPLPRRYAERMREHRLRREIVATAVANQLVDRVGTTFTFRLAEETGAAPAVLARGYAVAREVFEMQSFWRAVEELDNEVDAGVQIEMLVEGRRLVERSTRRLVAGEDGSLPIAATARRFESGAELLADSLPEILDDAGRELFDSEVARLLDAGVPKQLAARVIGMRWLPAAFDIVEVASDTGVDQRLVMETHFGLNARLELGWLRDRITELPRANRWEALSRWALRDDLQALHRELTAQVLESGAERSSAEAAIDAWWGHNEGAIERWLATLAEVRASRSYDTTTLPVALRELRALVS
jgi:glutamate dehydrogenase